MKKKVLLVGCGNIGSRHLQSLIKFHNKISIDIIEPSLKSKKKALSILDTSSTMPMINWFKTSKSTSSSSNLVIVATQSNERIHLIHNLLKQGHKNFLIEKMVCQSSNEYKLLVSYFKKFHAKGWVNTNRRYFNAYHKIKKIFKNSDFLQIHCYLGNSGLGTVSIHFIDLFCWFTNNNKIKLDNAYLINKIFPNKRGKQLKEFAGTIIGSNSSKSLFSITTTNDQSLSPTSIVEIFDGKHHIVINELEENFFVIKNTGKKINLNFKFGHTSDLTYHIVKDIFKTKSCNLPSLEYSYYAHSELFKIFNNHIQKILKYKVKKCPIT